MEFHGFGYRTNSRFADCVKVQVEDQKVTITGPRVSSSVYRFWIIVQIILLWSTIPMLLLGLILWDWRYLVVIPGLLIFHWLFGVLGAAVFWSMVNMTACVSGKFPTTSFNVNKVKRVKIGNGLGKEWIMVCYTLFYSAC